MTSYNNTRVATQKEKLTAPRKEKTAISRTASFKPARRGEATPRPSINPSAPIPEKRGRLKKKSAPGSESDVDNTLSEGAPPLGLEESSIGKRLTRRRKATRSPVVRSESSPELSADDENSDSSDTHVFRKSHSMLPELELPVITKGSDSIPKSSSFGIKNPSLWVPPFQANLVDVYVDGACSYHGSKEPKAGLGVWFHRNNPLNVSQRSQGRQTNNSAKIEAAAMAAQNSEEAGIKNVE